MVKIAPSLAYFSEFGKLFGARRVHSSSWAFRLLSDAAMFWQVFAVSAGQAVIIPMGNFGG
jgi:hypothetical protein